MLGSEDLLNHRRMPLPWPFLRNLGSAPVEATSRAFGLAELVHHKHVVGVKRFAHEGDCVEAGLWLVRQHGSCPVYDCFHHEHSCPARFEATSLTSGQRESVHCQHVPGVHRYRRYIDCVEAGLELDRRHVLCPVSDWFQHEYHVRVTLHDGDLDGDADHDGDADRDGDGDEDGNGHDEGDGDGEGGGDGFHVHSVRYHLLAHNPGPAFHVQNFGHYFPVRKFGFDFQVQNFGNFQGPFLEYWKGMQWPDSYDGSQVGLERMRRVQWLDIHPQADLLDASGDWTRYAAFHGDVGICSCFRSLRDLADSSGRSLRSGVYVYWKNIRDVR